MHQNNRPMIVKQGVSGVVQGIHGYMEYIHLFFSQYWVYPLLQHHCALFTLRKFRSDN